MDSVQKKLVKLSDRDYRNGLRRRFVLVVVGQEDWLISPMEECSLWPLMEQERFGLGGEF